jgi:hypothetical protein
MKGEGEEGKRRRFFFRGSSTFAERKGKEGVFFREYLKIAKRTFLGGVTDVGSHCADSPHRDAVIGTMC